MVTSFVSICLSRFGFSFFKHGLLRPCFKLKLKTKYDLEIWISISSYFENRKTISFYVLCLSFNVETKIKTLFLISHFNLSKKQTNKKNKLHFRYTDSRCFLRRKLMTWWWVVFFWLISNEQNKIHNIRIKSPSFGAFKHLPLWSNLMSKSLQAKGLFWFSERK